MRKFTLKAARVNAGFTQKEAAKKLGVSNKTLSSWENMLALPKADKIDAICELYDVTYDTIIFLKSNPLKANQGA